MEDRFCKKEHTLFEIDVKLGSLALTDPMRSAEAAFATSKEAIFTSCRRQCRVTQRSTWVSTWLIFRPSCGLQPKGKMMPTHS